MKTFTWRELTDEGLLIKVKPVGPYYDQDELDREYETEEAAVKDYARFKERHEYSVPNQLTLIALWRPA